MKKVFLFLALISIELATAQKHTVKEIEINDALIGDLYQAGPAKTVILVIAGSGPTDRNGNSSLTQNNALKYLAEGIVDTHHSVFTFDKRVVSYVNGRIPFPETDLDFDHGIEDTKTIIQYLKNNLHFQKIVIAGHSEGSLIGMVAAQTDIDGFISIAGAGNSIDIILKEQLQKQVPFLSNDVNNILKELKAGHKVEKINPLLVSLFNPQSQPFLMGWMQYEPTMEIKKLDIPILIISGTKDLQVKEAEAELLHKAQPKSEIAYIENMNHVLKKTEKDTDNMKSYSDISFPIHPELIQVIQSFLIKNHL